MAIIELTDQNFKSALLENNKTIVKFYAGWCGSCRMFNPKFKRLSNDERFASIKFVDVDAEKNSEARRFAGVSNLPYFAVFEGDQLVDSASTNKEETVVELLNKIA